MILSYARDGLVVVRQPDHGTQTGLFAAQWGNEDVPHVGAHTASQRLAATHHDDGWAVWERRPTLDPGTGQPVQFYQLTPFEHVPLYRAGIERASQYDPWAGLLVSMHGAGLYNDRYGTFRLAEQRFNEGERSLVDEFLSDMAHLQQRLAAKTAYPLPSGGHVSLVPEVQHEYLLLQVWDRLSLQYAFMQAADGIISPLPGWPGGELSCTNAGHLTLALHPYPFTTSPAIFPVRASVVPNRPYRHPEDFLEALAGAPPLVLECRAVRA